MKRAASVAFSIVFLLALFAVPAATLFGPRTGSSYFEQRALAHAPKLTWEAVLDGSFFKDFETALSDHIVQRDQLLRLNTRLDLQLGRPVVNGMVVRADVLLNYFGFVSWDTSYLAEDSKTICSGLAALDEEIKEYGGYFCYLGVPVQSSYFAARYPRYMDSRLWHTEAIRTAFSAEMEKNAVPFLDMHTVYDSLGAPGAYYSASDHHFTYRGALVAYTSLMDRINADTGGGNKVLTEDDLDLITLPNPFLGSSDRKIYGLWSGEEKLEIGLLKTPASFTRTDNGTPVKAQLYDIPADERDTVTYSVYMGGDIGETLIDTNRPALKNVLIFGDSFTNPLETLIWASFNQTRSLDLRYYTAETIRQYIKLYQPDIVVCVRDESVYLSAVGNGDIAR